MLLSVDGHGQRPVSNDVSFVLQGLEKDGGRCAPLLALDHRADGALLVGGVRHVQGLGHRATHRADKIHHLQNKIGTRTVNSLSPSLKEERLREEVKVIQHIIILLRSCIQRKCRRSLNLLIPVCLNSLVNCLSVPIHENKSQTNVGKRVQSQKMSLCMMAYVHTSGS